MREKNKVDEESLSSLAKALEAIDEENERKEQAARISRAVFARAEAERINKAAAACLLQSYWRGISQREEYIALKKAAARKTKAKKKPKV